jgi:DNA primase
LSFALLPAGQDPDDLIRDRGAGAMRAVLDAAVPMVEMCWRLLRARHRMDTPERRAALERDIERTVQGIEDRAVAQQYRGALRDRFWTEIKGARQGRRGGGQPRIPFPAAPARAPAGAAPARAWQEAILLATILNHPDLLERVAERLGLLEFEDPRLSALREALLSVHHEQAGAGQALDSAGLVDHLKAAGHGTTVDRLLAPKAQGLLSFALPTTESAEALRGWHELFDLYGRAAIEDDLREARARYEADLEAGDTGERALARLMALQAARSRLFEGSG